MKIFVEHQSDLSYWSKGGTWTLNPEEARDFENVSQAREFCASIEDFDIRVVRHFENDVSELMLDALACAH